MQEVYSKYQNEPTSSTSKRLFAGLLDSMFLIIITFVFILGSAQVIKTIPAYKQSEYSLNEARINCYKIEEEAKLYEFKANDNGQYADSSIVDFYTTFNKWCLQNVLLSYSLFEDDFIKVDKVPNNPEDVNINSWETDNLAYFFKYAENNDILDFSKISSKTYYYDVFKTNFLNLEQFILDEEKENLPVLKSTYAIDLYRYLFEDEKNYQAGLQVYNLLISGYKKVWDFNKNTLFNSSEFSKQYKIYKDNFRTCSLFVDGACVLSYLIAFLIVIVLPQVIFKSGRTFSNLIFKQVNIVNNGMNLTWRESITRNFFQFLMFAFTLLPSCFLGGGLNAGWMYPILEIGSVGVSLFNFSAILLVIPILSSLISVFRKDHKGLTELISKTQTVDISCCDEKVAFTDLEKENKNIKEIVIEDDGVFDSSRFNNTERDQ